MRRADDERKPLWKELTCPSLLSLARKLDRIEALWAELSRDEKNLESPARHKDVLEDGETAFQAGKVSASDREEAKKLIRKRVS